MEYCVEEASKTSSTGVKLNHFTPSFSDDFWAVNGVSGDDFFVDGLLDFSSDGSFLEEDDNSQVLKHTDDSKNDKISSLSPVKIVNNEDKATTIVSDTELCFPVDDVADLEWVSQFVEDSFSGGGYFLTCSERKPETETVNLVAVNPSFRNLVQKKARSKRSRTGGRVWSLRLSSSLTDSSNSCSSSSSCTSNALLPTQEILGRPPTVKRQKKKKPVATADTPGSGWPQQPRRCSHCLVQKTPQWRAGPLGAKTLCNACGVRFKSGRLFPEYRPAGSPNFSSEVHSNNHRKVLEMRQKKEAEEGGPPPPVAGSGRSI
ncbi:GATA transcription factor 5 [Lactuca sativa]|uniref:GATA transcription factor n=1 Tax=Lactuca sativa TaxID=4236 RepID=A0A9R1WG52_LACSA|nr:GATA transcription factor 5 [Lactuca sativa]XP_023764829.1 GATA transcription factor 5 [Lactuca sativa]XP_042755189.1 GATA transcription factor 5 [Lactuca sativa]KAJ0221603.1 hypothetical protein LSAT_V11C200078120 [Lactuca sativa]